MTEPRAPIGFRKRRPQEPERPHLGEDLAVEAFLPEGRQYARKQAVLGVAAGRRLHQALVLAELARKRERILPVERGGRSPRRGLAWRGGFLGHGTLVWDARHFATVIGERRAAR